MGKRVVFFGTPDYVIPILEALKEASWSIVAVVTQSDKPVGRKQILTASGVALWAKDQGVTVFTQKQIEIIENLNGLGAEVGVIASYGRILPTEIIDVFPKGIINVHPSLLPKYRGASPIAAAIAAGEEKTGVTIIKLDELMDHGPILDQVTEPILSTDTSEILRARLFEEGAKLLVKTLPDYLTGNLEPKEQDHSRATYVTMLKKEDGFIPPGALDATLKGRTFKDAWQIPFIKDCSLSLSAESLDCFIRAVTPWPGAYTILKMKNQISKRLKILKAHVEDGRLILDVVQLEGKRPVSWRQFVEGYPNAKIGQLATF